MKAFRSSFLSALLVVLSCIAAMPFQAHAVNDFYSHSSGAPSTGSLGSSATMRAEFDAIATGFDKLPTLTGNGSEVVFVNAGGTALETKTAADTVTALGAATVTGSQTLTNKTISLGSNTVSGTTAQFNTALSDGDFATLAGAETLTNKTLTSPSIATPTVTGAVTLSGGQIAFPASQSASADANTLDDYEEGTWTPGIAFGGASTGVTYSIQAGTYTKIGRLVTINFMVDITSKGSSTGVATVTGSPFFNSGSGARGIAAIQWANMNSSFVNIVGLCAAPSIALQGAAAATNNNATSLTDVSFTNVSSIAGSCTFHAS